VERAELVTQKKTVKSGSEVVTDVKVSAAATVAMGKTAVRGWLKSLRESSQDKSKEEQRSQRP
jgi:hypothetical protein